MKLFRSGDDDALIQEAWFCGWFLCACLGAYWLWHWAGVVFTIGLICGIHAKRSL